MLSTAATCAPLLAGNDDDYEDIEISPEDERALAAFMNPVGNTQQRTLADIILEKIKEKERGGGGGGGGGDDGDGDSMFVPDGIDGKVVEVYRQARALHHYTTTYLFSCLFTARL